MCRRNWGLITFGSTFEALATTIIFFEDPKAALFGRRGKDGGQDARSGDGIRVFQAKHHQDGLARKAIASAKKEAKKIASYRIEGHGRYEQWKGVTCWRLVTNAAFNPTDREVWDKEVVPLFVQLGLDADYWEQSNLDALLDNHPEIDRSFFHGEVRAFLTVQEIRDQLPKEEIYLQRKELGGFFGRDRELKEVRDFLDSDATFLVVHGSGGVGKTRLVVQAGEDVAGEGSWRVLWANVASMNTSGTWFEAVVPEQATMLIVDEPDDEHILRVLAEQLRSSTGRVAKWKVVVAVRSPKDPVLRFMSAPRMKGRVKRLEIGALFSRSAEAMYLDLLASGSLGGKPEAWRNEAARKLAKEFSRHPVWMTLAVHLLEMHGDLSKLPQSAQELAVVYLEEIVCREGGSVSEQVFNTLRWTALLRVVNREDETLVKCIAERAVGGDTDETLMLFSKLVHRGALVQRGARERLVEIKPDVMRDYILRSWLSTDVGYGETPVRPSTEVESLIRIVINAVSNGTINPFERSILTSLARTERLLELSGRAVPLLDPFFSELQEAIPAMRASVRLVMVELLMDVAMFRPTDTLTICCALCSSVVGTETIDGLFAKHEIGQDDITLELPWLLYHVGMGAQSESDRKRVFEELCLLTEVEAEIGDRIPRGLPNDGKRAASLLGRTLYGGPEFGGNFETVASTVSVKLLNGIAERSPTLGKTALAKALLEPAMALERQQTWDEGDRLHVRTYIVAPGHPAWKTRRRIVDRIKAILANNATPSKTRALLWRLFGEAHRSGNRCRGRGFEKVDAEIRKELLANLRWARGVLEKRRDIMEELASARDLWDWHRRFEEDSELKEVSEQLEVLYVTNDLVSEFEPLLSMDHWEEHRSRAFEKAEELAKDDTSISIEAFIGRAVRFLGGEKELYQLGDVFWAVGGHAARSDGVRMFIKQEMSTEDVGEKARIAARIAAGWVMSVRKDTMQGEVDELVDDLARVVVSDGQRMLLMEAIYGERSRYKNAGFPSPAECDQVRTLGRMFVENGRGAGFIDVVGWTFRHDWLGYQSAIEGALQEIPQEQLSGALDRLVDAACWAAQETDRSAVPSGLTEWLLKQLLRTPDLDRLGANVAWRLDKIMEWSGRPSIAWLVDALTTRHDMAAADNWQAVRAYGHKLRLSRCVTPISRVSSRSSEVVAAVRALLDLIVDRRVVTYYLSQVFKDVDPEGLVVPTEVEQRLVSTSDWKDVRRLAGIGGVYSIGSEPWRVIAKPVIARAFDGASDEERRSLFSALTDQGPIVRSKAIGEVSHDHLSAVERAREWIKTEVDPKFLPFWEWYLKGAEAELGDREEQAKEERGE